MKKMKDSGIEWLGDIPEHWEIYRLKFLCNVTTGNKDTIDRDDEGKYPFFVRSPKVEKINSYSYDGEAILMAGDGVGAGKVFHYFNGKFDFHQRVYNLHSFKYVVGKYFFYYLSQNFYREIEKGSAKSTVDSVRLPMILNFPVSLPPLDEQKKIAAFLDEKCSAIDSAVDKAKNLVEKLSHYKKSLITETVTKGLNPSAEMKDSNIEWLGDIPEHWKIIKLKYLGTCRNGLTYSPNDVVDEAEGVLVLRSSNIQNGKLFFCDNVYVKTVNDNFKVKKGDILICSRNGSRELIGKNALIDVNIDAYFGVFMIIFRSEISKYIYFVLNSDIFGYYLGSFFTSTINQLTIKNFNNIKIPLPPLEEQKKIADFLDKKCAAIDENISRYKNLAEKLSEYKKSLIYEVVTGKVEV